MKVRIVVEQSLWEHLVRFNPISNLVSGASTVPGYHYVGGNCVVYITLQTIAEIESNIPAKDGGPFIENEKYQLDMSILNYKKITDVVYQLIEKEEVTNVSRYMTFPITGSIETLFKAYLIAMQIASLHNFKEISSIIGNYNTGSFFVKKFYFIKKIYIK